MQTLNPTKYQKIVLALIFLMVVCSFASAQTKWGDVNGNNTVDIIDALLVAQYSVGSIGSLPVASVADVSGDGKINIIDALQIAQYYIGVITVFPAENKPTPSPTSMPTPCCTGGPTGPTLTPPGPRPPAARNVSLNTPFVIAYGETVAIPGFDILITFKDVQDSRCPTGLMCLVAGEAVATLELWAKSYLGLATIKAPTETQSNIFKTDPATGYYHIIQCTAIEPYPVYDAPVPITQYKITLTYTIAVS